MEFSLVIQDSVSYRIQLITYSCLFHSVIQMGTVALNWGLMLDPPCYLKYKTRQQLQYMNKKNNIIKQASTNNFDSKGGYCRLTNIQTQGLNRRKKYCTCIDLQSANQAIKFVLCQKGGTYFSKAKKNMCRKTKLMERDQKLDPYYQNTLTW